ncbi:MAG: hypothetical protein AB7E80_05345 [Hyphomicrobiaceae bacterium]
MLAGCSGNGLETSALQGPAASSLPSLPKIELPGSGPAVVGTPTELYERISRGLRACWMQVDGPLNKTHLFEATAEPAHKGGNAEIVLRERETEGPSVRGTKAVRIAIAASPSSSDSAMIEFENLKLPADDGRRLEKDVRAWATGVTGCKTEAQATAWSASEAAPPAPANLKKGRKAASRSVASPAAKK